MCEHDNHLEIRRSFHVSQAPKTELGLLTKSDANFTQTNTSQHYKKYDHDEVPVKDSDTNSTISYGIARFKGSLTNSDLDHLEKRIYNNVSQELQTDESSFSSLDSNIKFFKTTVEKIFDNFFTSMSDFEYYKKRFNDIIGKTKEGSVDDMEDFIKDMFEHIMSADKPVSNISKTHNMAITADKQDIESSSGETSTIYSEKSKSFVEAYKNNNYLTDSKLDDNNYSKEDSAKVEEIFNIFLLGDNPCVKIKLGRRTLLSEVQIKDLNDKTTESTASADDLRKLAAKKLEVEEYIKQPHECISPERDIPVKIAFAKKNIHLNEDFARISENCDASKSLLAKICGVLCKKFHKNTVD